MRRAIRCATAAATLCLAAPGCVLYRGPSHVREQLAEQTGNDPELAFGLKLGFLSTRLAASVLRLGGDDAVPMQGVSGARFAVYEMPKDDSSARGALDLDRCRIAGWETVVAVRDGRDQVLVQLKMKGDEIRGLLLIAADDEELVYVRLRGHLDRDLRTVLRNAVAHKRAKDVKGALVATVHVQD